MSIKRMEGFVRNLNRFLFMVLVVSYALPIVAQTSSPESKNSEPEKKIEFTPPKKNADELFKEAAGLSEKNPEEAIRLYQRAFQSKPDAWEEHRKIALLFEKMGKYDAAVREYESINNAVDTAQSHADLARALEKTGGLPSAAAIALRGAEKFPEDTALTVSAGNLLLKTGQIDRAVEFLKRINQKNSGDKQILFILGQALEQQGDKASALKAYMKSIDSGSISDQHKKAFDRLAKDLLRVEDLWVIPPKGWEKEKDILSNTIEGEKIYIAVHPAGDINQTGLKVIRERMPKGMFDDGQIKGYENMRKLASELSKESPDIAKGMMTGKLPVLYTNTLTGNPNGLMVMSSSSEEPSDLLQTVCSLVLPSGNKVYTLTWVSSKQVREGEKALLSMIDQIVLP